MEKNMKRIIGGVIGIVICLIIATRPIPQSEYLNANSMRVLGIFVCAIVWWIFGVFPEFVTGIAMCTAFVLFKASDIGKAFGGFGSSSYWMLFSAIIMGVGIAQTGILSRLALWILQKFPPSFKGQTIGMLILGLIINPLIPTANAKVGIVAPFAQAISDGMGYERHSKGAAGIFAAFFLTVGCGYPLFTSASFQVYTMCGLLPNDPSAGLSWSWYFMNMIIWGLFLWIGSYIFIRLCFKPEKESILTKEDLAAKYQDLGPMRKDEKLAAVILVAALVLFMTNTLHGISSTVVSMVAVFVLLATKTMSVEKFNKAVPWNMLMYMGSILGLTLVIPEAGIDKWIGEVLQPIFAPLISNPVLFIVVLCLLIYVVRALIVSQTAVLTIFVVMVGAILQGSGSGMAPFIAGMCIYMCMGVFYVFYQNTQYQTSFTLSDLITQKQGVKMCIFYMIINIVGILCSIPLWKATGFWTFGM